MRADEYNQRQSRQTAAAKARYDSQLKSKHESWELERQADRVMRQSELAGDPVVVLTASEATALLSWIRRAEDF